MTADFSDLRVMERLSQLQPGGGTSKYFRHPTERQNNRSTHGHTRPSVLSCQTKSNQIHSEMLLLPLWGDYSWYYNNNAGIECVRRPFSAILCFTVLLLTYSATTDQAKQENAFQLMEAELKSLFMKECIVHFNRTMWRASPGVLFLLHLLLIYMCDFLEKKKTKHQNPISPGGHKQFALLFSNNPNRNLSIKFFPVDNVTARRCPTVSLTRFLHLFLLVQLKWARAAG